MKVVFLDTTMDGASFGGAHTFLTQVMKGLSSRGVEVHFVTKGVPISKTAVNIEQSGALMHNKLWANSQLVEDAAPLLADWLDKLNPDIYVVSVSPDIGWVVLPLLSPKIATCAIGHNDSVSFYDPAQHYGSFLTRAIGVSLEICRQYEQRSGIPRERVTWIPYGVETEPVGPRESADPSRISLVYVGRLEEEQKRSSDLARIAKELNKRNIPYRFTIIGDGVLLDKLKTELDNEIRENKVQFTGWLKSDELMKHLRRSDVFILPSAYEGFCISLVEAMANGCSPVVTSIESGNKQLVTEAVNGYLVPVGDIHAFADRIETLASQPSMLLEFRKNAWETGRKYSIDKMVSSYYDCFSEAMKDVQLHPRTRDTSFPLMPSCRSKYPTWLRRLKSKAKGLTRIA